jgi:hypothetical protein
VTDTDHARQTDYDGYARFCLELAAQTPDRATRLQLREMAAAWLNLSAGAAVAGRPESRPALDGHG